MNQSPVIMKIIANINNLIGNCDRNLFLRKLLLTQKCFYKSGFPTSSIKNCQHEQKEEKIDLRPV